MKFFCKIIGHQWVQMNTTRKQCRRCGREESLYLCYSPEHECSIPQWKASPDEELKAVWKWWK